MPCSRSARRPSVSRARSSSPSRPRRSSSWSARIALASCSRRPMSVDLPSSTLPAVARRTRSERAARERAPLEVADNLAVLHGRLGHAVVRPRLAAFGDAGGGDLGHHVGQPHRLRAHRAGAAHVAHGAVAHRLDERLLAVDQLHVRRHRVEHPVAMEDVALVGEVDRGDLELLGDDVLPDVELGPVAQREDADVLAAVDAPVVEVPQLGTLALGVPRAEVVAEGHDPLLGARALLIAPGAAERRVEAVLADRVEQRRRLQPVARGARAGLLDHAPGVDRLLHGGDDQALAELGHAAVAELEDLREVVPGVDVHEREREPRGAERLLGQPQQHDRVLAAAEQQHRLLELGRDLAHHVDRLGLERLQVGEPHAAAASGVVRWRTRTRWRTYMPAPAIAGTPTTVHVGTSTPALLSTPIADPSSTQPRTARSAMAGTFGSSAVPIMTPGSEPMRMLAISERLTLPTISWVRPAAHSMIAAWKTSVPTTRCGVRRKTMISASPTSAPEPTEVMPSTMPSSSPMTAAPALLRRVSGTVWRSRGTPKAARASTEKATMNSAPATSPSSVEAKLLPCFWCSASMSRTPLIDPGTEPTASHFETPMSTVPARRWRHPPSVLVI